MDERTRTALKAALVERANADPAFREALLQDTDAAITSFFGRGVPEGITLHVLNETASDVYLVLPVPPPTKASVVTLREITADTVRSIVALAVKPEQTSFVASNAASIALAHFSPLAWIRAIYAADAPVGFVMLKDDPDKPEYYLWRYMIAGEYQGLGFGLRALQHVIAYVQSRPGARELTLSYVPGDGSARDFYMRLGFVDTGVQHGGENEMRLVFA